MNDEKDRCASHRSSFLLHRSTHMIALTRLNGQRFVCCESGERLMVKESLDEVIRRAIEYARAIRKPITE